MKHLFHECSSVLRSVKHGKTTVKFVLAPNQDQYALLLNVQFAILSAKLMKNWYQSMEADVVQVTNVSANQAVSTYTFVLLSRTAQPDGPYQMLLMNTDVSTVSFLLKYSF